MTTRAILQRPAPFHGKCCNISPHFQTYNNILGRHRCTPSLWTGYDVTYDLLLHRLRNRPVFRGFPRHRPFSFQESRRWRVAVVATSKVKYETPALQYAGQPPLSLRWFYQRTPSPRSKSGSDVDLSAQLFSQNIKSQAVADLGEAGHVRPPGPKCFHFHAVFRKKWSNTKSMLAPPLLLTLPPGKSWIHHCRVCTTNVANCVLIMSLF